MILCRKLKDYLADVIEEGKRYLEIATETLKIVTDILAPCDL